MERILVERGSIIRHSILELAEHWILAISGLLLIFSGFGELPMYKRFLITHLPGLSWAGDFFINLKIHYISGMVFVSVMVFHAFYHGWLGHQGLLPKKGDVKASILTILSMLGFGEEPKSHKYLPEQRLAYAYLGGIGLILVITGMVKVIKNLHGVFVPPSWVTFSTLTHTFATIFFLLGVLVHLVALIFKVNRPLAKSIFTGEVDLKYVRDRHTLWYEKLIKRKEEKQMGVEAPVEGEAKAEEQEPKAIDEQKEETMITLKVKGMSCQHCVMSITKALNQLEGIKDVQVDLEKGEVRFDNTKGVTNDHLKKTIADAGYEVIS